MRTSAPRELASSSFSGLPAVAMTRPAPSTFALLQGAGGLDHVVGGEALEGDGGGLLEAEVLRDGDEGGARGDGEVRVAARIQQGHDPVALRGILDVLPHL